MISVDHRHSLAAKKTIAAVATAMAKTDPRTTHVINTGSKDNDDNGNLILVDKNKIYMVIYLDISTIFRCEREGTIFAEGLVEKSN